MKKLVCIAAALLCPMIAWLAGAMMWGWSDARGNTGEVITPDFFSGVGAIFICGPLLLLGLGATIASIWQGFRILSVVAVILNFAVAKSVFIR